MRINRRKEIVIPVFKVKGGHVFETRSGNICMKFTEEYEQYNAIDLDSGSLCIIDNAEIVKIKKAELLVE